MFLLFSENVKNEVASIAINSLLTEMYALPTLLGNDNMWLQVGFE